MFLEPAMKSFLCGVFVPVLVLGLASFTPAPSPTRTVPLKLSDLTLDRAFRETVNMFAIGGTLTLTMPPSSGVVITTIATNTNPQNGFQVTISKNGGAGQAITTGWHIGNSSGACGGTVIGLPQTVTLDPPFIARPGDTLTISCQDWLTIGGYAVFAGEV